MNGERDRWYPFLRHAGIFACMLVLVGSAATAQHLVGHGPGPRGDRDFGRGHGIMGEVLHDLDLTEEQRDQVRATVHEAMEDELGNLMRQHHEARHELEKLIHDPEAYEDAILDAAREVGLSGEQLALERHRMMKAVSKILNEEQRAELRQRLEEYQEQFPRRHGRRDWDD